MYKKLIFLISVILLAWAAVSTAGSFEPNLAAHYEFEGNTNDSSGNNHHGNVFGNVTFVQDKTRGFAAEFGGREGDYINIGAGRKPNASPTWFDIIKTATISLWVKGDQANTDDEFDIISKIGGKYPDPGSTFRMWIDNNLLWFSFNDTIQSPAITYPLSLKEGQWYHLAATYNEKSFYLYIDGLLVGHIEFQPSLETINDFSDILIGSSQRYPQYCFKGLIDDVRIYNGMLDGSQVAELYAKGISSYTEPVSEKLFAAISKAENNLNEQKANKAIALLENAVAECKQWRMGHPADNLFGENALPEVHFLMAKAKEVTGMPKQDIASQYRKVFNFSYIHYIRQRTTALIWLLENHCSKEYTQVIRSFIDDSDANEPAQQIVFEVCKYFESNKDQAGFEQFLDILFAEVIQPFDWVLYIESRLEYKTSKWAKQYYKYLNNKPQLRFVIDKAVADKFVAGKDYRKAADIYRDIVNRCGPADDKSIFELKLYRCLFSAGDYAKAVLRLEKLIAEKKATNGIFAKEAMLILGQAYVQLGDMNKAVKSFLSLMIEYPEAEEVAEANFFIGYCYALQGKFSAATEAFEHLIRNYPEDIYVNKANLYLSRIKSMSE